MFKNKGSNHLKSCVPLSLEFYQALLAIHHMANIPLQTSMTWFCIPSTFKYNRNNCSLWLNGQNCTSVLVLSKGSISAICQGTVDSFHTSIAGLPLKCNNSFHSILFCWSIKWINYMHLTAVSSDALACFFHCLMTTTAPVLHVCLTNYHTKPCLTSQWKEKVDTRYWQTRTVCPLVLE